MPSNSSQVNLKAVVFYEGKTEWIMLKWFFDKYCFVKITEDLREFFEESVDSIVLEIDCHGHQNVFPKAIEFKHFYEHGEGLVLIRDLEQTPCHRQLKDEAARIFPKICSRGNKITLFAKPHLEEVYFADSILFAKVIDAKLESQTSKNSLSFEDNFNNLDKGKPKTSIKALFKNYDSPFHEVGFADEFFSQFEYMKSGHHYFVRLRVVFDEFINPAFKNSPT